MANRHPVLLSRFMATGPGSERVVALAVALVVVLGVALPVAAWLITRRLAPLHVTSRLGAGYDAIDKWLLDRYQLAPHERWRVRQAVFRGQRVSDARLTQAAHGLAVQVLSGGFRGLRVARVLGWVVLAWGIGSAGAGIATLVMDHQAAGVLAGSLYLIGAGGFIFAGTAQALLGPKQMRQNARKARQLNQNG